MLKFSSRKTLKTGVKLFWGTVIALIIAVALVVQLGRLLFPHLDDYKPSIERLLSSHLNASINVGHISGRWEGMRPHIALKEVTLSSDGSGDQVSIRHFEVELNLLMLLKDWRSAFGQLHFKGLNAEFRQTQQGTWRVAGLAQSSSKKRITIDDPLDVFLFGRRLDLIDTQLAFRFRTGHFAALQVPVVSLENDANFHRLKATVDVDDDLNALQLVVEGIGDPRDEERFHAQGYLDLAAFPLQKVVAASGLKNLDIEPGLWSDGSRMDLRLWFDGSMAKGLHFSGHAQASGLPIKLPAGNSSPAIPQFEYQGRWQRQAGLALHLKQFALNWPDANIPPLDIALEASLNKPASVRIRELDITAWSQVLNVLKLSPQLDKVQKALSPGGTLRNIGVVMTTPEEGYFQLQGNLSEGAVNSWRGAPKVRHAAGYVEASAMQGRLVLAAEEAFLMHFPVLYKSPLEFDEAVGEVAWFVDLPDKMVHITSGLLNLKGESGEGSGYLYLSLPLKKIPGREPEMTLAVGMRESFARYHETFVPKTIPKPLYKWLGESIQGGELSNSGFYYRGSLLKKPRTPRSLQVSLGLERGQLAYHKEWPALQHVKATLLLDDFDLRISLDSAELLGNRLSQADLSLTQTAQGKNALAITGNIEGDTKDALALLRNSPIEKVAGKGLSQLEMSRGSYRGNVALIVPVEGDPNAGKQVVSVDLEQAQLSLPDVRLSIDQLNGHLVYDSDYGLRADALTASLWGRPFNASLSTLQESAGRILNLQYDGRLATEQFKQWLSRPLLHYVSGDPQISGTLRLPFGHKSQALELTAYSNLQGTTFDFPEPLGKSSQNRAPLDIYFQQAFKTSESRLKVYYDDMLNADLLLNNSGLYGLDVAIDKPARAKPNTMHFHGELDQLDAVPWARFISEYLDALSQKSREQSSSVALAGEVILHGQASSRRKDVSPSLPLLSIDLKARQTALGDLILDDLVLTGQESSTSWLFNAHSSLGNIAYERFRDGQPSVLRAKSLMFPEASVDEASLERASNQQVTKERQSIFDNITLENIEPMDVQIDQLKVGDKLWGNIAFDFRPEPKAFVAKRIRGNIKGISSTDSFLALYKQGIHPVPNQKDSQKYPESTQAVLQKESGSWQTTFDGILTTGDLGEVLLAFDLPKSLTSTSAKFDTRLYWSGYPDEVGLDALMGSVDAYIKKGQFLAGQEQGDTDFLKLLALFNFDTLMRRLKLDFSDLNSDGLSYDSVKGTLQFKQGIVELPHESPLIVDTSSADITLKGDVDLMQKTIDSHLAATLPITGNLAVAAALAAGLPVAMGVYVVGKIFEDQVDDLTRVKYNVRGPWDKPKFSVDNISGVGNRQKKPSNREVDASQGN